MKFLSSYLYSLKLKGDIVSTSKYRGRVLSLKGFSRFKHGDGYIAEKYGLSLYQLFVDHYTEILVNDFEHLVIACPVNKGVTPTIKFFQLFINSHLCKLGKPPIGRFEMKFIGRGITRNDYASRSKKDREDILGDGMFVFDQKFSKGKKIIVIDDLRVTGTYENAIKKMLEAAGAECLIFLYIIQVPREVIEKRHDMESILDHFYINNLARLGEVLLADDFILNQRVCKFLLTQEDLKNLREFLRKLPNNVIREIYTLSVNEGYEPIKVYEKAFSVLENVFLKKNTV